MLIWQPVNENVWFGLVWFDGISTILGYIMPNPVYSYISDIGFETCQKS